ncbi:MAG: hypothetical protein H7Y33_12555 [Cytophagales bacterium]|nr:hypothetical protein [Rhizobacter sp.]
MRRLLWLTLMLWLAGCCSPPAAAQSGVRNFDQVRNTGSLRGTDLDGDWVVFTGQRGLQPDAALLRRFDHLLAAMGEVDLRELRQWIAREVTRERDAATAAQVLAAWDEHLAVLQGKPTPSQEAAGNPYPTHEPVRPTTRGAVPPRALLTPEPTLDAAQLQALQKQRVERFGAEAAVRLRTEDAARWAWAQRLAQARAQLPATAGAEQEAYLKRHFSGTDLLRARTLLGLPP